ncbi:MAG: hypothetical protein BIFFINMI_04091 [Phycisphaerae bacterium]|nr:hypothetical protein [Phycisphaerae bacterium]
MTSTEFHKLDQLLEALVGGSPSDLQDALRGLRDERRPDRLSPEIVEKVVNTAALLLTVGQSEQVCIILAALNERCGPNADLLNNLAYAHMLGGRQQEAIRIWEEALTLAPGDDLIASNLARARESIADRADSD